MSIIGFRLAREAQELKEKQQAEMSSAPQEVCPMPVAAEIKKEEPVEKAPEFEKVPTSTSSRTATVKAKPKTTTQK
jgi:hypothetical protein